MRPLLLLLTLGAMSCVFLVAASPALAEDGEGICACYDPPPPPPPPQPPPAPPPPPPPPPSLDEPLELDAFVPDSVPYQYFGLTRCKTQTFTNHWSQAGLFRVLTYKGSFRVCYRPGNGIVSIADVHGDATWTKQPWSWKGNDAGYPYGVRYAKTAVFQYRGTTAICFFSFGCGPDKHPWVSITFYDNNTMTRSGGVV
jgi:hypothetical protein